MKARPKGPMTFPTGKFPVDMDEGTPTRPFTPQKPTGIGPQTWPTGVRFGGPGITDPKQKALNPQPVRSKGPQVHKDIRFGDMVNQNQDPSPPYNPK